MTGQAENGREKEKNMKKGNCEAKGFHGGSNKISLRALELSKAHSRASSLMQAMMVDFSDSLLLKIREFRSFQMPQQTRVNMDLMPFL
jgi:hypothetical protein